jgi:hypothetical protein
MILLKLRRYYFIQVALPLIIILLTGLALHLLPPIEIYSFLKSRIFSVFLLVLAALTGLGLPLLFRSVFAYRTRNEHKVPMDDYLRFDKILIFLSVLPLYIVSLALALKLANFYLYSLTLVAIYAAYTYYPSQRRLSLDQEIFRVENQDSDL